MPASAPTRSTMKFTLTIGILPLALDVFTAVEESSIARAQYVRDGATLHKAGMNNYDTVTGKNIERSDIIKCMETPDGTLVEVTDEEMQSLLASENGSCTFIGFLPLSEFHYSTEKPYQVRPQKIKAKVNPYDKPFALILEAMHRTKTVALLSFVSRGKTRYAAIDAGGVMCTLRFDEEVREERPLPEVTLTDQDLALGGSFIDMFKVDVAPVLHDEDSAKINQYAVDKAKALAEGGEVTIPVAAAATADAGNDLMALMAASLQGGGLNMPHVHELGAFNPIDGFAQTFSNLAHMLAGLENDRDAIPDAEILRAAIFTVDLLEAITETTCMSLIAHVGNFVDPELYEQSRLAYLAAKEARTPQEREQYKMALMRKVAEFVPHEFPGDDTST